MFQNPSAQPGNYRSLLGLDEIDTHVLDLQYLASEKKRTKSDSEILRTSCNPDGQLKHIREMRVLHTKHNEPMTLEMIKSSRVTLLAIRSALAANPNPSQRDARGNKVVEFKDLGEPYPLAEVVVGKAGTPDVANLADLILGYVDRAESVLKEAEATVIALQPNLPR